MGLTAKAAGANRELLFNESKKFFDNLMVDPKLIFLPAQDCDWAASQDVAQCRVKTNLAIGLFKSGIMQHG